YHPFASDVVEAMSTPATLRSSIGLPASAGSPASRRPLPFRSSKTKPLITLPARSRRSSSVSTRGRNLRRNDRSMVCPSVNRVSFPDTAQIGFLFGLQRLKLLTRCAATDGGQVQPAGVAHLEELGQRSLRRRNNPQDCIILTNCR